MKDTLMFIISKTKLSIAQLATSPFRWGWDSNQYVPLMWSYHLQLLNQIQLMSSLKLTRITNSLSTFSTSTNNSMTYWIEAIPSMSNIIINIDCHISSKWVTKFGYVCRRSALLDSTTSFAYFAMVQTPLTRL